jgi:uncharacterized protein YnzC (UPF0291/DUF896 family)
MQADIKTLYKKTENSGLTPEEAVKIKKLHEDFYVFEEKVEHSIESIVDTQNGVRNTVQEFRDNIDALDG